MKRNMKHIVLASVLCLLLAAMFAFAASAADPLTVAVKYQKGALKAGESFTASVYVENSEAVTRDRLVGLTYSFAYDASLFEASNASVAVDPALMQVNGWNNSAVSYSVSGGKVSFASHVIFFDASTGYADTLKDLFSVTFTAKAEVADVSEVFSVTPEIRAVSTTGEEIATAFNTLIFTNFYLDDLIVPEADDLVYAEDPQVGGDSLNSDAIYLLEGGQTVEEMMNSFSAEAGIEVRITRNDVPLGNSAVIVSGCEIELYELGTLKQKAMFIVKGDADGSGTVDVFDAVELLRYVVGDTAPDTVTRFAMKVLANGTEPNVYDVVGILKYIANGSRW